ncbi:ketoacyl-ACP synthase III [Actinosynnema sp. NPDC047251]|uniref:3-oxoacyl-(Acyl carrier protein) synthase III n=1 Tax=Saccharothrix espanaensis (strain ATCC 51144 / DSM 44229 / JCM 9112 / NBRC 15066 / NRRL 15764) TaxID=1179773 RepID=K0JYV9_SACES|nr:ketoacyl-ACP synthase III [Saccharothrix espanaensis]CCH29443.1 3-oxoacyl-(acyl carrier protein) synthase III [Saccharothrix espanaensis DSM 44229]
MEHLRERTRPRGVGIRSIGRYLPDRVVSNADLERILLTRDDWIRENIGVRTRRMAADDQWTSDLGAAALLDACARAGVRPSEVDLVVCGTYTPDHMAPPTAMLVIDKSGAVGAAGFDVNSGACPGGVFALDVGAKYLASGQYRRVAVVLADVSTRTMDWKDPGPAVIFGDGAACYLLEPCTPGLGIGTTLLRSDPSAYQAVRVARERRTRRDGTRLSSGFGDNFSTLDGNAVHGLAVGEVPPFVEELLAAAGREVEDIDLFALHQANLYIVREIMAAIGVPMDRTVVNIEKYGNTSGASVPLVLREAEDTGRLSPGDQVVLAAFGSGFSMGAALVRWCGPEDFAPEEFAPEEFAPEKLAPEQFASTGIRS